MPLPALVEQASADATIIPDPSVTTDDAERADAQAVIDGVTPETQALVEQRGRVPPS